MDKVRAIVKDEEYQMYLDKNRLAEADRKYCKHDYHHALHVGRLAYLLALEKGTDDFSKGLIYATALLHDIGRWVEYATGEDHCAASARLAGPILRRVGFTEQEQNIILAGVLEHRKPASSQLGHILALADDLSRECYRCTAVDSCYKAEMMQQLQQQLIL